MKKFIKWLADISGVTKEIKSKIIKHIGSNLIQHSYWFYGGVLYKEEIPNISNFAFLYGHKLAYDETTYVDISSLRDTLYKMQKQNKSVYTDREIFGWWSDNKEPHFIKAKDYKQQEEYKPQYRIKWD